MGPGDPGGLGRELRCPQHIRKSKCFGVEAVFHSRTWGERRIVALAKNSLGKWATRFEPDETI